MESTQHPKSFWSRLDQKLSFTQDINIFVFWIIFFSCTWFTICNSIVAFDLWWHIASGRYLLENGYFPQIGTFSEGVVIGESVDFLRKSALGDILLYLIFKAGGLIGLQAFKTFIIFTCIGVFMYGVGWKRNIWSLGGIILLVVGLNQLLLIKNAIFSLFFLAIFALLWMLIKKEKTYIIPATLFIPLSYLWANMHGTAMLGILVIIMLFIGFVAECLFFKRDLQNVFKAAVFFLVVVISYISVSFIWHVGIFDRLINTIGSGTTQSISSESEINTAPTIVKPKRQMKFKDFFRIIFTSGTDQSFISEYASPFDFDNTPLFWALTIMALILISMFFLTGSILKNLSILIPSLFLVYISFGYLRTSAFPFCFALPLIAFAIANNPNRNFNIHFLKWSARSIVILIIGYFGFVLYQVNERTPYKVSGFYGNEPGIGNSIFFKPDLPQWVAKNLPQEKVYNSYSLGGYLIWEWYNQKKVLMDGRSIIYNKKYFYEYLSNSGIPWNKKSNTKYALIHMANFKEYQGYFDNGWIPLKIDTSCCLFIKLDEDTEPFIPDFMFSKKDLNQYAKINERMIGAISYLTLFNLLKNGWAQSADNWMQKYPELVQPLIDNSTFLKDSRILAKVVKYINDNGGLEDSEMVEEFFQHYVVSKNMKNRELALRSLKFYSGKEIPNPQQLLELEKFQPSNRKVLATLAVYFIKVKQYKNALSRYRHLIKLEPNNPETYYQMASVFHKLKQYDDAIDALDKSIQNIGEPLNGYIYKSIIYFETNKYNKAKEMIDLVLKIDPKHSETIRMLNLINQNEKKK